MDPAPTPHPATHVSVTRPAIVYASLFAAVGAYVPYITLVYADLGLGLAGVGVLSALNAAVSLVAAPGWGILADRRGGTRTAIVVASLWAAAAATLLAIVREPAPAAVAVSLLAAAAAALAPLLDTRTVDLLGSDRDRFGRARAWGSAAFVVGALAVGLLVERFGPPGMFLAYVPLLVTTALAAQLLLGGRERRPGRVFAGRPWAGLVGLLRESTLAPFFLASVLMWAAVSGVIAYASIRLVDLGGDPALVGVLWSFGAIVEVPLMLVFPAIVRRTGPGPLVALGAVAFVLRAAGWAVVTEPVGMIAFAALGGVGFAFVYVGTVSYVARAVPPSVQATAQGLFSGTAFSLGSIGGSAVAGAFVTSLGLPALFAIGALAGALAAGWIAVLLIPRRSARRA